MKQTRSVKTVVCRTIGSHFLLAAGVVVTVCGAVLASLLPPMILGKMIDALTMQKGISAQQILGYFGMLALTGLLEALREGLLTIFGQKMTHALRSSLMEKLVHLTAGELSGQEPGALVSRFVGDVDMVENLFTSGIISMFADACRILSILAVIWFQNRGLALILLVLLPFLFWFTRYVQKNMLRAQLANRNAVSKVSGHVPETLHNIRTIHCLSKESYMEDKYEKYISESYRAMEKTNFYDAIYSPVILILNAVVVAVVMLFSSSANARVLALFGMSAGTAVAVMNYIAQIFTPIESLGMEIQTIQSAVAGIRRVNDFFRLEELPEQENQGVQRSVPSKPFVAFRNVTFGYGEQPVLRHLNFEVYEGEQVTLEGRTGAGKSTVLKLLLGMYSPQEGEILLQGTSVEGIRKEERRRLFGYVEQSFHMVPGTVREQITLFDPEITEEEVQKVAVLTGLDADIHALPEGYDTICTPELFSQGQWQLLSIARAAVAEPRLLLLDEITANLDAETEREVLQALKRVSKDRTVISISHRTSAEMGRIIHI